MSPVHPSHRRAVDVPDPVDVFLAEAARVEPDSLPTAGQLLWRAEILARLEAEDRRHDRVMLPLLAAGAISAAVAVACLTLLLAEPGLSGTDRGPLSFLVTEPTVALAAGVATLAAMVVYSLRGRPHPSETLGP